MDLDIYANHNKLYISHVMRHLSSGFLKRSDEIESMQPEKGARGLKFQI